MCRVFVRQPSHDQPPCPIHPHGTALRLLHRSFTFSITDLLRSWRRAVENPADTDLKKNALQCSLIYFKHLNTHLISDVFTLLPAWSCVVTVEPYHNKRYSSLT